MNNFNNRHAITKIRLSSHNFAINTTKWYNLPEGMKICKNCEKNNNKYDNMRRKAFNDINAINNTKLQKEIRQRS